MDPRSYVALTHAMDSFDVRAAVGDPGPALHFVAISSDRLFLPADIRAAAQRFADAGYASTYAEIESTHGHDAFLAEPEVFAASLAAHGLGLIG